MTNLANRSGFSICSLAARVPIAIGRSKAEPLFRQALSIREKLLPKNSPAVLESLGALGECLYLENRDAEAEPVLRRSVALDRELNSDTSRGYLALLLERKGEYPEALR